MRDPIAIVGIGCRFPGGSNSPDQLWDLLKQGKDAITEVPAGRWHQPFYYHPDPARPGRTYARWGGFLQNVDLFDAQFFSMSPREAMKADPQQRLLLEVAFEAIEDAGLTMEGISGRKGGVFVGVSSYDYGGLQCSENERNGIDAYTNLGSALSIVANRVSYFFNLHGPSLAVDTACSSALVATHLACQSIWNGESELALAGGVSLMLRPEPTIGFSKASMLSPDGRCKSFDGSANGYARAEGAGIVVLKPLSQALADRDPIYAVIRTTAMNQDGRTGGITVPSSEAQQAMLREALDEAAIAPESIQYVEAHGTGTPVGDPIEATAIGTVLGQSRPPGSECLIGSIKSNFGHLEAASGSAGLIKAALCVQRGLIPASLHVQNPNPQIPFEDLRLRVVDTLTPWPETNGGTRRAGVNSFGFGGTNAHVILESAPPHAEQVPSSRERVQLMPLSARSPEALRDLADSYASFLENSALSSDASLENISYTASLRRSHHDHRLAIAAHSKEELAEHLRAFLADEIRSTTSTGRRSQGQSPVFICSGMGQQWWAMGRQLLAEDPLYRETMERIDLLLRPHTGWSLLEQLLASEEDSRIHETHIAQPAIFAMQVALAALWNRWGIRPLVIVGHSVGEVAAAYLAGALSLEDAVKVIYHRSRLQQRTAGQGTMLAVSLSWEEANSFIAGREAQVSVGAVNSPRSITLSGDEIALREIADILNTQSIFCRFLQVEVPYHSPKMDPLRQEMLDSLASLQPHPTTTPLYSTVFGTLVKGTELDADYWWRNLRHPVQFHPAVSELIQAGHESFVELSAHPVLSVSLQECLAEHNHKGMVLASLRRKEPEYATMLGSLGSLYTTGVEIEWQNLHEEGGEIIKLPTYPWQRERYWYESEKTRQERLGEQAHPLLGRRSDSAQPRWSVELDLVTHPYLTDHRVQGAAVFPAAGYVEMGLAAAREQFGTGPCVLEDIVFEKALFLSEMNSVLSEVAVDSTHQTFQVSSQTPNAPGKWNAHAGGTLRVLQGLPRRGTLDIEQIRERCSRVLDRAYCYRRFRAAGLEYGPAFQSIERLWCGEREALGEISLAEDLHAGVGDFRLHPALLDAAFQVMLGTLIGEEGADSSVGLYLPVRIERLAYYAAPGTRLFGYARLTEQSGNELKGDLLLCDEAGNRIVEIRGFVCRAIDRGIETAQGSLYQYQWKLQTQASPFSEVRSAGHLLRPSELEPVLQEEASFLRKRWARDAFYGDCNSLFRDLAAAYIVRGLMELGWDPGRDAGVPDAELADRLGIISDHRRLFTRILHELTTEDLTTDKNPEMIWKQIWEKYPSVQAELIMIRSCGQNLPGVLRGETDPLGLLFPEGSSTTAEHLYQDSPTYRVYNLLLRKAVSEIADHLPQERMLRVLEIGGGTGGLSAHVLPVLPPLRTQYTFTDIAPLLVAQAEQSFRDYTFLEYQTLDIESDPAAQGFEPHSYDIILASDVLHATRDMRHTLNHVKQLLASEGTLLLLEGVRTPLSVTLVFGLLKGWWLFTDSDLRDLDPWISREAWQRLLAESGFTESISSITAPNDEKAIHAVIVARGPEVSTGTDAQTNPSAPSGAWLVLSDEASDNNPSVGDALAAQLQQRGEEVILAYPGASFESCEDGTFRVQPAEAQDIEQLLNSLPRPISELRGILHLWSLHSPPPEDASRAQFESAWRTSLMSGLYILQSLGSRSGNLPGLWLITRGAELVEASEPHGSVAQSALWGLGSTAVNEYPQVRCRLVDLGEGSEGELRGLLNELSSEDDEDQIALRGERRYIRRLTQVSQTAARNLGVEAAPATSFRVVVEVPGILDTLSAHEMRRRPPGPGEVEIEVVAASLNFKDVMMAMALLPPEATRGGFSSGLLGLECSGRITAVGAGVEHLREGDAVLACGPACLASHLTFDARFVALKPAHMGFEEAATIPVAFLTAYYALHTLGRIQRGERILIHAATGGVGLAALQLAQLAGAEVFATAGSPAKRGLLRALGVSHVMDSRSVAFAEEVLEQTNGEGVDLVLNSLSGEAIPKSLSVLRPYGRFIEIGKRDIYENNSISLRPFGDNLSFFAVDLDRVGAQRPELMHSLFREVGARVENKELHPLPYRLFPLTRLAAAFRHLAQAKHIGKVVISIEEAEGLRITKAKEKLRFRSDGTYLITGGLGGFGLAVADWFVEHGARHLVLASRGGAATPEARAAVQLLEREGTQVTVAKVDVTVEEQVRALLADVRRDLPPIRGVLHAAMVLEDTLLPNMTEEKMWKVLLPKALGAWHFHRLTLNDPLDLFVLFSSFTSLVGNPGQANYVAGNTFLDTLAHYRRAEGLPALAVNWGAVAEVGFVARNREIAERLEQIGMGGQPVSQLLATLGELLENGTIQAGVAQLDWHRMKRLFGSHISSRFSTLVAAVGDEETSVDHTSLQTILDTEPSERASLLENYLQDQLARVLRISAAKLDPGESLLNLGLDSLMAMELRNRIQMEMGVDVPPVKFMEGLNLSGLASFVAERLAVMHPYTGGKANGRTAEPLEDQGLATIATIIEQLSDQEVDEQLRTMLAQAGGKNA